MRIAVVTVSDSAVAGTRADRSGPALVEWFVSQGVVGVALSLVPDEIPQIVAELLRLVSSDAFDAVFTTGGTGISARDVTPEATGQVLDREIPGIGERMRAAGRSHIETSILSRSVAGSRGSVLIVNLPGSPRGAVESLEAIWSVVPHAIRQLQGDTKHE